jgi:cytochrome c oxidase subunit 5a
MPNRKSPVRYYSAAHEEESHEALNQRYTSFFESAGDLFELQRGLNNIFAYDSVPLVGTIEVRLSSLFFPLPSAVPVFRAPHVG